MNMAQVKYELSNMMVSRPIYGTLFAGYLTEQTGTGTEELGRCFSVSLGLMYL